MNNKAHLRPKDFDSNGDIIPMSWREEKGSAEKKCEDCMYHKFFKKRPDGTIEYYCPYGECIKDKEHTYKKRGKE